MRPPVLTAFSVENYRAFSRVQEVDIRPLTLFFGWNSAGKSALVRFLPLLAESLEIGGPPIWLSGKVGRRATWPELVSKGSQRDTLGFSVTWNGSEPLRAEFEIRGDLDGRWQETTQLRVRSATSDLTCARYGVNDTQNGWEGLLPSLRSGLSSGLEPLRERLAELRTNVQWISGVRVRPPRQVTYGGGAPAQLSADGSDSLDHLIAAQLRSGEDPLLTLTREFFAELGHSLELDNPSSGSWRVMLRSANAISGVNLCDTGEGYSQVLPVLVALARSKLGGPEILCLEQPELHLHTRAQSQLGSTLVKYATNATSQRILVETHSEVLLMSLQLAIARGEISADKVRVYWVEGRTDGTSEAIPIDFNENGQPNISTLTAAFSEVTSLGQQLVAAQMARLVK
jgi:hypothetical protein